MTLRGTFPLRNPGNRTRFAYREAAFLSAACTRSTGASTLSVVSPGSSLVRVICISVVMSVALVSSGSEVI